MFRDITPKYAHPERLTPEAQAVWKTMSAEEQQAFIPQRIQEGVYLSGLNPRYDIEEQLDYFAKSMGNLLHRFDDERDPFRFLCDVGMISCYGVCDGVENLLTHPDYAEILNGPRTFSVFLCEIQKEGQGERGWRWHKWGPYIGAHEPKHEYLADEEGIERVFVFEILEHRTTLTQQIPATL